MDPMLAALGTPLPTKPPATRPTKPPASRPRIAVVAINSGNTNLGDEAVLMGALQVLRTRVADPAITVFSVNPADTSARHGVDAVPLPIGSMDTRLVRPARRAAGLVSSAAHRHRILAPAVRRGIRVVHVVLEIARQPASVARLSVRMRGTDLMILAGSNQMEDSGGAWGYPWVILLCTVIARLAGARVAFVSVGAGPLHSRLSQQMCLFALRLTTYASFRDTGSLELMRRLGYRGEGRVVPDLAYALEVSAGHAYPTRLPRRVAVNVFPFHDPYYDARVSDQGAGFAAYADALAEFVVAVHARGMETVLFGTQRSDQRALALILDRIHALAPELVDVEERMPTSHENLLEIVERSDVVVATRYHGIVIGTLFGRPTIGVCYQAKSRRLLQMAGIAEFAVDVDRLSARALLDKLTSAIEAPSMSEQIRARALEMHSACWRGFDEALERCIPDSVVRLGI